MDFLNYFLCLVGTKPQKLKLCKLSRSLVSHCYNCY